MKKLLGITAALALAVTSLAACSGGGNTTGSQTSGGPVTIRFAWWGNDVRNKNTQAVIDQYMKLHPNVTIVAEPGEWSGYWDKLSTQIAGGNAPDIIQMDEQYLRDYATKGVLAPLDDQPIDTKDWGKGLVDTGKVNGKTYALVAGVNALSLVANPTLFQAAGVSLPDDTTWTWNDLRDIAAKITANSKASGVWGVNGALFGDSTVRAWMFQHDKSLFTETGLGWEPSEMQSFFDMMVDYQKAGAIPSASINAEDFNATLAAQLFGTNKAAMALTWSNQITAQEAANGQDNKILMLPSLTGNAKDANLWYKAGQYQSITSTSKVKTEAAQFLDYFFNSEEAGKVLLAERGLPPNLKVREAIQPLLGASDKKASEYMARIESYVREAPVAPPPGVSTFQTIMQRNIQDVQFGRATTQKAAQTLYDEAKSSIK